MKTIGVILVGILSAGCGTERVVLKHPQTGTTVACGPYARTDVAGVMGLRGCIEDFQRQGFERVAE